jgi:UDP-3-O-[3-hydroxymyristoyl] glucosamine N-acyltransferase
MVGIVDHITTVDDVIISATSTVNKDIKKPGLYTGILPILEHANWKRIAFWISKLDKIAKSITLKK